MKNKVYIRKPKSKIKKGFSANAQLKKLKLVFPELELVTLKGDSFVVVIKVKPTPLSRYYDLKVVFDKYKGVNVFVINEILPIAKNRVKLPHVYSHKLQQLCLYSKSKEEWTREKLISSTIIPWACEWLQYYELWLIDGQWLGGGHNEYE